MSADRFQRLASLGAGAAALVSLGATAAHAQTAQGAQAPESYTVDGNNVDVIRGTFNHAATDVAIGPGAGGLAYTRTIAGDVQRGSFDGLIEVEIAGELLPGQYIWQYTVSVGAQTALFQASASTPQPLQALEADGSTLEFDGVQTYTYIDPAGVVRRFDAGLANPPSWSVGTPPFGPGGRITEMVKPNGERWDWHYRSATLSGHVPVRRIQSVTSSLGYQIKFEYAFSGAPASATEMIAFGTLSRALGINNVVDWCDPAADVCSGLTQTWPQAAYATTTLTGGHRLDVTNALAQTTRYTFVTDGFKSYLSEIDWPEPGRASTTVTYSGLKVASYSDGRGTWNYTFTLSGISFQNATVTDPNGQQTLYRARLRFGPPPGPTGDYTQMQRLNWFQDPTGARTYTEHDDNGRLIGLTYPEENKVEYDRDGRGNIIEARQIAKPTAPAPDIVASWVYPATCTPTTRAVCNQPTSATDARGAVRTFAYDTDHGGLISATRPAAAPGEAQPETRYAYQELSAWRRTSASGPFEEADPIFLPVQVSACASGTAASCVGTSQEVRTTTAYQVGNASTGSNLLPLTVTTGAGDGSLQATTTSTWDARGDQKTIDGPLAGAADTTWYAYDALRRNVGTIAPDPDGAGPLPFPATRTVFNADGRPTEVEQGSATAQSDGAFAAMAVLSEVVTTYDAQARKIRDTQVLGSGVIGVTQYGYDDEGRLTCTAVRMNPSTYGGLPASACGQPAGSVGVFGEDRITRNSYDLADRLEKVESGVATTVLQVTRLQDWTPNGKIDWVQDANQNRSDYAYDGFDRMVRLEFPLPTTGAQVSNPNDYEAFAFDPNGNLVTRRLRDGQTITFAYDALNRETTKTVPGLGTADDVFTTYDLLDRRLTATFVASGSTSNGIVWTWDAMGRPVTETAYGRTLTSTFDLAGRRTRLTWPAPFSGHVDFGWDLAGRMTTAAEGPTAGAAATYAYDPLGRRTSLTRTGAATTTWSYVPNSRDWSMTHDLAGGATNDVTWAFVFNPAGQAVERDTSNPAYQFALPTQSATPYVRDGLNQYDSVNGVAFIHDARGNLTSDGVRAYGYDVENRLVSVYQGGVLQVDVAYDPLGRIKRTSTPTVTEQYLWDGDRLVGTFDGYNVPTGRWLHGPGPDEPLAQLGSHRWLLADHQGSITAETDASGALVGTPYTYDPYGRPDAAHGFNGPRFRYSGQTALVPSVPLWHYKARAYDPAIGRFLQADPIGYEDSLNLYQYVGNDPFNGTDPTGKVACETPQTCRDYRRDAGPIRPIRLPTWREVRAAGSAVIREIREDPVGVAVDVGVAVGVDLLLGGPSGEGAAVFVGKRAAREAGTPSVRRLPRDRIAAPPERRGRAPTGDDGNPVELHHNQQSGRPEAEMTRNDHRLGANYSRNHPNTGQQPSRVDQQQRRRDRERHWNDEWDSGRWD